MEQALAGDDAAAVIMETIPATYGFPLPEPGYLESVKALCERHGTLYIADEVQTGLMRTGEMWAITKHGIEPDILVTGKGLSGGMYPIAAVLVSERSRAGSPTGSRTSPVRRGGARLRRRAEDPRDLRPAGDKVDGPLHRRPGRPGAARHSGRYPGFFTGIRQNGVVMGLEFDHPEGAKYVMRHLYRAGVWAIFSTLDPAGAAVQAGPADDAGTVRGTAGADGGLDRRGPMRRQRPRLAGKQTMTAAWGPARPARRRRRPPPGARWPAPRRSGRPPPEATTRRPTYRARQMLARAHWAAEAFATYDRATVLRIAEAVARAAHAESAGTRNGRSGKPGSAWPSTRPSRMRPARSASSSSGIRTRTRQPAVDAAAKIVSMPRPACVILALTPSTNPVCSVFFKVILALLTRNAIVVSPHPMAQGMLRRRGPAPRPGGRPRLGPPDGDHPASSRGVTVPLVETLMADPVTDVIVATGGTAMVRAAYRSGNPALGVGSRQRTRPGRCDRGPGRGGRRIVDSKAFDNSVLCTNESVSSSSRACASSCSVRCSATGASCSTRRRRDRLRAYLFPDGMLNGEAIGKDAAWIAWPGRYPGAASDALLLAPADLVVPEEPFAQGEALAGPRRDRGRPPPAALRPPGP